MEKTLRQVALALYKPPFKYMKGYIFDSDNQMVADQGDCDPIARIRGWGRISYLPDADKIQDEMGEILAEALTEYYLNHHVD